MLEPKFIDVETTIAIHDDLIETFEGSFGIRDIGLLESALSQPKATFFGEFLHSTIAEQAAAYLYHIAKNHAFIDGNKRTSVGVMEAFLRVNGYNLDLSDDELYELALKVSTDELEKTDVANIIESHLITFQLQIEEEDNWC
ncbi:type II toxin-antitoxin system death-on-curing family toxin [Nostoc paludosum FACHB-159]|uniref:Type II toxin-antitoxin system death-on-curing family toxin n=1 Tax=Nostoc paludosum FACHB-159 TaxID=2692908 RepID=A0ABR8KEP4_9NOSO|nr:type II toxin-antitoxin system death-on-curing family toxin [Nostoc sp. FACHB-857]MBD2738035.1 type II toxin-antitoxin system death-on-curing family toxin [Nostoc paludosum FACHB-159]